MLSRASYGSSYLYNVKYNNIMYFDISKSYYKMYLKGFCLYQEVGVSKNNTCFVIHILETGVTGAYIMVHIGTVLLMYPFLWHTYIHTYITLTGVAYENAPCFGQPAMTVQLVK